MAQEEQSVASMTKDELQAKVYELEAELARKERESERRERRSSSRRADRRELSDTTRDTTNRIVDEYTKLFRGFNLAYLESVRATADAVGSFAEEVARRNPAD